MGSLPEEEFGSLPKRTRLEAASFNQRLSSGNHVSNAKPSQYNPHVESSLLGLRLRKSPSFLDLIQNTLSQSNSASIRGTSTGQGSKKDMEGSASSSISDKLKASNFPASLLRIGSWEYISKYEGDLVAKFYFAKKKLVWEVVDGDLKNKIEIQWSDIMALKADLPDDGPGALTLVLAREPAFQRETDPQPRKHTQWQETTDFTGGQASKNKKHFLQCPNGILNKHYEKLIQCDMRLGVLSQQPEIVVDSPYFKSQASVCEESPGDGGNLQPHAATGLTISASLELASLSAPMLHAPKFKEEASPKSVMDTHAIEGNSVKHYFGRLREGPCVSMSMTNVMNHSGNGVSEQMTCGSLPSAECRDVLENISQLLLSDSQCTGLDERSLMKKVNSFNNLLQDSSSQVDGENGNEVADPAESVDSDPVNDSSIHSTDEKVVTSCRHLA